MDSTAEKRQQDELYERQTADQRGVASQEPVEPTPAPAISMTQPGAALATKIARVMGDMAHVPKLGWNDHQKYSYATESDIADMARKAMAAHNLALIPSRVSEMDVKEGKTARGNATYLTTIRVNYLLIDGDSGERMPIEIVATGVDTGEKGIYKAYTGAKKYALLQLFLISTGEDDPERTTADHEAATSYLTAPQEPQGQETARRPSRQRQRRNAPEKAAEKTPEKAPAETDTQETMSSTSQQQSIYVAASRAGLSEEDVKRDWLGHVYKVESAKDLTHEQARELINFMRLVPKITDLEHATNVDEVIALRDEVAQWRLLDRPKRWWQQKVNHHENRLVPDELPAEDDELDWPDTDEDGEHGAE